MLNRPIMPFRADLSDTAHRIPSCSIGRQVPSSDVLCWNILERFWGLAEAISEMWTLTSIEVCCCFQYGGPDLVGQGLKGHSHLAEILGTALERLSAIRSFDPTRYCPCKSNGMQGTASLFDDCPERFPSLSEPDGEICRITGGSISQLKSVCEMHWRR